MLDRPLTVRLLFAATVVLGAVRYAGVWGEPWGQDPASGNGQWYQGEPVRIWQKLGFQKLRGIPMLGALPTEPPVGSVYAHHPPTVTWMVNGVVSVFGFSEASIRIVPIFFSALTGGLLVLLAARRSLAAAVSAAILWLILPMSFVYGIMCNPEAPTLFWIVLTVMLHDRLRDRSAAAYAWVVASQFIAGMMDWEGHFAIPALGLYEMTAPAKERRLARVAVLGCASLASATVVVLIHGYFSVVSERLLELVATRTPIPRPSPGSIGAYWVAGIENALRTGSESIAPQAPAGLGEWIAWQFRVFTRLFTWPAAVATVCGVALPAVRRTELGRLGAALLVPGLLNVLVFSKHGAHHDYWLYYLLPGVIVTSGAVVLLFRSRRAVVILLLVATVAFSAYWIRERMTAQRSEDDRNLAREIDALLEGDEILVVDVRFVRLVFYADHWLVAEASSGHSWEHLAGLSALVKSGRLDRRLSLFVVPLGEPPPLEELRRHGTLETIEAAEVARKLPTLARFHSGPVWLLRVG